MTTYKLNLIGDNKTKNSGHMYTELVKINDDGTQESYFYGKNYQYYDGIQWYTPKDNGKIETNIDLRARKNGSGYTTIVKELSITENQFNSAKFYADSQMAIRPDYKLYGANCVDFVQDIYSKAGQPGYFAKNFSTNELKTLESAGIYADTKYGYGETVKDFDKVLFSINDIIDYSTNKIKDGYEKFYNGIISILKNPDSYSIQPGDTISQLAEKWGVSVEDILNTPGNEWLAGRTSQSGKHILIRPGEQLPTPDNAVFPNGVEIPQIIQDALDAFICLYRNIGAVNFINRKIE